MKTEYTIVPTSRLTGATRQSAFIIANRGRLRMELIRS